MLSRRVAATIGSMSVDPPSDSERTPIGVLIWFTWALGLLALTGLLLPRIVGFTDFSERAPFSLLGIFIMAELALVLFGVTVALQRKRIAHRFALGISFLPVPILAGLPPALFEMPSDAATGWYALMIPAGLALTVILVIGLLRPSARAYFTEP